MIAHIAVEEYYIVPEHYKDLLVLILPQISRETHINDRYNTIYMLFEIYFFCFIIIYFYYIYLLFFPPVYVQTDCNSRLSGLVYNPSYLLVPGGIFTAAGRNNTNSQSLFPFPDGRPTGRHSLPSPFRTRSECSVYT